VPNKVHDAHGAVNTKDLKWATHSVKLGWDVIGIHPMGEDGTHINGVATTSDETLLASADDFGLVNIYNYPVLSTEHQARSYSGHSEHVVRAIFSKDGKKLYSVGGGDETLI
jgi:WD40 repeat protein